MPAHIVLTAGTAFTITYSLMRNYDPNHAYGHGQHVSTISNYKNRMTAIEPDTHASAITPPEHRNPFQFCFARQQQPIVMSKFEKMTTPFLSTNILQMPASQFISAQDYLKRATMVHVCARMLRNDSLG